MKKIIVLSFLALIAGFFFFKSPMGVKAAGVWDRALLGGLFNNTEGITVKVDSEGKVYVNGTLGVPANDTAYNESAWDGVTNQSPSMNTLRDKFVSVDALKANLAGGNTFQGNQTVNGTMQVNGTGVSTFNQGVILNELGGATTDDDIRMESDTLPYMLFLDASQDSLGFGYSTAPTFTSRFMFKGAGNNSSTSSVSILNSDDTESAKFLNDGMFKLFKGMITSGLRLFLYGGEYLQQTKAGYLSTNAYFYSTTGISGGTPAIAGADPKATILPKVYMQGTGALTNGTTNTKTTYIDDTPTGEWAGSSGVTLTAEPSFYKDGAACLRATVTIATAAGATISNTLAGGDENWTGIEHVGFWIYPATNYAAGDWTFRITDSGAGNTDTNLPALVANKWQWVTLDISGVADASKDVVQSIAFVMAVDNGLADIMIDFLAKWDATDEIALTKDVTQDGILSVISCPVAAASAMAWTQKVEYTNYFVSYGTGATDKLVPITDESANAWIINYAYSN